MTHKEAIKILKSFHVPNVKKINKALEVAIEAMETYEQPVTHDPYLQPGWPCEVWWGSGKTLRYYNKNKKFVGDSGVLGKDAGMAWLKYKPIGTEWDFIHADIDEVVMRYWDNEFDKLSFSWNRRGYTMNLHSVLPKEYEGQIIQRPEWAK
jgi:hypothetical protein